MDSKIFRIYMNPPDPIIDKHLLEECDVIWSVSMTIPNQKMYGISVGLLADYLTADIALEIWDFICERLREAVPMADS